MAVLESYLKLLENCESDWAELFSEEEVDNIDNEIFAAGLRGYITSGFTKAVIVTEEDYVLKLPFVRYSSEDYNPDYEEFETSWTSFTNAGGNEDGNWDHAAAEVKTYEKAKEEGIGDAFVKIEYLKSINHFPIYRAEKVIPYNKRTSKTTHSSYDMCTFDRFLYHHHIYVEDAPMDWLYEVFTWYGEEFFIKLAEFIEKYHINDLRKANVGYTISDGRPIILDYSGYNEYD